MGNDLFQIGHEKKPAGHLKGRYKLAWVEEALDVEAHTVSSLAIHHTRSYLGKSISSQRIKAMFAIIFLGVTLLLGRFFQVQIINGEKYRQMAEGNRIRLVPIVAERGIIYDRFEKEMVQNIPTFVLSLVPQDLPRDLQERARVIERVAQLAGVTAEEIQTLLERYHFSGFQSLIIRENLDHQLALRLYTENSDLPGILIESGTKRRYVTARSNTVTSTASLSHILGYLGKINEEELSVLRSNGYLLSDVIGKAGLEKMYESHLRGVYGRKKIEVDALGREQSILAIQPPEIGSNLVLSIDIEAQQKLESALIGSLKKMGRTRGAAIAMDPRNGGLLAMVSWPAFDNNQFSGGISSTLYKSYLNNPDRPLFNRVIGGTYPPGSTLKLAVAAAALQEKVVTLATSISSVGGIRVGGILFKDWKAGGHGATNVTKAIAWSVNTFFYYVAGGYGEFRGLGIDRLRDYLAAFSLGEKLGIDLPGENPGFLPSKEWKLLKKKEQWFVGDTYNVSIGQGDVATTPLQVASWTATIANGGKIFAPYVVESIVDSRGNRKMPERMGSRQVPISGDILAIVRQGMRDCVSYGSCKLLQSLPFSAAGKTGTAQWRYNHSTHAWFTSFAPFDEPEIIVTVLVEEGGEGAAAAMPVARDFLAWWGQKYLTQQ